MYSLLQLIYLLVLKFIHLIQPILVPLCFVLAWGLVVLIIWQITSALRDGFARAQQMHRIPCADCSYFTDSHFLKCPLHPHTALTEEAIGCRDYESDHPLGQLQDKTIKD
jgi:hypothetical protein